MAYTGRLASIISNVRIHINEASAKNITDDQIVALVMLGYKEVARLGYWRRESTIDVVSGQYIYDLSTLLSRFNRLHELWWSTETVPMQEVANKTQFERIKRGSEGLTTVTGYIWCVHTNQLYIHPTPTENVTAGMRAFDSYYPDDLIDGVTMEDITGSVTTYTKDSSARGHFDAVNANAIIGAFILFSDDTYRTLTVKTSDGTHASDLTISSDHATGTVSNIYRLTYASNVTPEWPEQYDDFLTEIAASHCWLRDGESARADWWFKKSRQTLGELFKQNRGTTANVRPG